MADEPEMPTNRFARLPEPLRLEDTVEVNDTEPPRDPEGGRNTDHDFLMRYPG
ncbi:heme biosynthesis protein HemY [Nocardioides jensenii]|uniref:heme biosynthesis protein HemY n=1 Tax=Nocardioides jensenii TaxID=1843 RepID=UPI000A8A1959|nr:heme biosynthesis protein HemY [Nocardioides jensenii]